MKKRPARLTERQTEKLIAMREKNASYQRIADRLGDGRSPQSIAWHCLRLGVEPIKTKFRHPPTSVAKVMARRHTRGVHMVKRFTPEEDEVLLRLEAQQPPLKMAQIAKQLGRRRNSVVGRLYTLARHERLREQADAP